MYLNSQSQFLASLFRGSFTFYNYDANIYHFFDIEIFFCFFKLFSIFQSRFGACFYRHETGATGQRSILSAPLHNKIRKKEF